MKKTAAILALVLLLLTAAVLTGCSNEDNSEIVGEWKPSTVSINGTTISYSDLDTKGKDFSFNFYPDGKCKIIIGGVSNDGSYAFHQTSVDIQYGGKSQKLSYDHGILTLKLDYNDQTTAYMFTKVSNTGQSRQNRDGTLCCDDLTRENGNLEKAESMRKSCEENGWTAVSMKDDWTTIYGDGVTKK